MGAPMSDEEACTEENQSRIFATLRGNKSKSMDEIAKDSELGESATKLCLKNLESLGVVHRSKDKRFSLDDAFLHEFEEELDKRREAEIRALEREVYLAALKRVQKETDAERRILGRKQGGVM
jgi:DNA-binding IclR family transcriptional regulator